MQKLTKIAATLAMLGLSASGAHAQSISITTVGSTVYTQNFDTLGTVTASPFNSFTSGTAPINGFYARQLNASSPTAASVPTDETSYRADTGASNTGAVYSYASTAAGTDRAFGSASSGTPGEFLYGFEFINNTGVTLTSFTLTYDGEQYRNGGNATAQSLFFSYSTSATSIGSDFFAAGISNTGATATSDPAYTSFSGLNFTSPVVGTTAAAVDGNGAGLVSGITGTVSGLNIAPGGVLWIRFADLNDAGNDHGLAIDNISLSVAAPAPTPEPSSIVSMFLGAGTLGLIAVRRRRTMNAA